MSRDAAIGKPASEATLRSLLELLGGEVRSRRARLRWTQQQAAAHADIAVSTYGEIERGTGNPTFRSAVKVSTAFGLSLPDLLRDSLGDRNL